MTQPGFVKEMSYKLLGKRTTAEKTKLEDKRQKQREEDSKMVTGVFKNLESRNGTVTFPYRAYKEDPFRSYTLTDGQTYTIPLGVAKHINNNTTVSERDYAIGPDGTKKLYTIIRSKRSRFQFVSTDFM